MPNTLVRAAAEGMPDVNRRRLLNLSGAGCHRRARASSTLIIHVHVGPADSRRKGQKCKKTAWECPLASLRQASLLLFAKIRGGLFGGYSMKSGRVGLSA